MTPAEPPSDPGVSRLYQTHLAGEPPAALDAAILAAARQAVVPPRRPWWQGLQIPVAVAATGMLAVMLTLTMQRNPQEDDYPPATAPAAAPDAVPTRPATPSPAAREQAEPSPTAPALRQPRASAKDERSDGQPAAKAEAAPAASPATASAYIAPPAKLAAPPQEAPAATAAPPPAPGLSDNAARHETAGSAESMEKRAPTTPAAAAPAAQQLRSRAIARSPDDWLAAIRKLREQGQPEAAAREWEAFRKAYPDYPLPEDLRLRP